MEVKKYDKIVLDSTRSIDDIVAGIKAELSKQESENTGESYICYVSHAYSSGQNAGVNYIVVSDEFKNLNRLSSNVIKASAYTKDEINELIARVEAQIPVDEANLATKEEVNEINSTLTDAINTINTKANADAVVNLTDDQTIDGVKTFSVVPVVATQPTDDNQVANKAYVDSKSSEITRLTDAIATKANADAVVNLTGEQTIDGVKTFSVVPVVASQPTEDTQVANKAYVDSVGNTKANANATVNLTGEQTIAGTKTFSSPVVVPNATANTHAVNLAQLNTKANANATVNLTGNQTIAGVKTFSAVPVCATLPTADTQLANRNYVKKRGAFVAVTGGAIDLNNGINFSLNLTAATNITVANAAANIGQTGEIFIAKGANIKAFSAPFNFRIAQSGFGANEVFSYLVVSANLVRITRS